MKFNINDMATVTLTAKGAFYLSKACSGLTLYNEGEVFTTELWYMMQIFGPYIHFGGKDQMFVKNNISIVKAFEIESIED